MTGSTGHSVTFTWTFSGAVDTVTWGIKEAGVNAINYINGLLVVIDKRGVVELSSQSVPNAYKSRVSGNRTGDSSSGGPASHSVILQKMMRDFMDVR